METKYCKECKATKPVEDFYKNTFRGCSQGLFGECIECHKKRSTERRCRVEYGITYEYYLECMATSDVCEICGTNENLVYDHCHDSMAFRGVLCRSHNVALGKLGDNSEGVKKAYDYLLTHREKQNEIN